MKKLLYILCFISLNITAQNAVSFGFYHDAKFLLVGDSNRGYPAGTLAVTGYFKMAGYQQKHGFMYVSIKGNYTRLKPSYLRYGFEVGYTFNKWFKNFEYSIAGGAGSLSRNEGSMLSLQGVGAIHYKINRWLKIGAIFKYTQRKDLSSGAFKPEGDIGVEITL